MSKLADETQLWDQQPQESAPAFEAFQLYRDMGAERSVRKVAERLGKNASLIGRWSMQHGWVARARAWDREQDRQAIAAMRKKHAAALSNSLAALSQPVGVLVTLLKQEPLLPDSLAQAIMMERGAARLAAYDRLMSLIIRSSVALPALIQAERLVHGMSTQNMAVRDDGADDFSQAASLAGDPEAASMARALVAKAGAQRSLHVVLAD